VAAATRAGPAFGALLAPISPIFGTKVERLQRRSAERVIRAAFRGRPESRDDLASVPERRHAVADALVDLGNEGVNGLAKPLEQRAATRVTPAMYSSMAGWRHWVEDVQVGSNRATCAALLVLAMPCDES
jgi:hypothetical protein